jgi:hypothetical protein
MLKSIGLVDNIKLNGKIKLPVELAGRYLVHDFYNGKYPHKLKLQEWVKSQNGWGRYPIIFEFKDEYERKDHNAKYQTLKNIISLVRLVNYNSIFLQHVVSFENSRVTISTSNDDFRPSSFLGKNEEITKESIEEAERIVNLFKKIIDEKQSLRLPRAVLYWDYSSCSGSFERKAVELFTALEALFTTDSSEISYKLANRASWFIERSDPEMRRQVFDEIRKGYDLRSKIVHGDDYSKKFDIELVKKLHSLTRDIILKMLQNDSLVKKLRNRDKELINDFYHDLTSGKTI